MRTQRSLNVIPDCPPVVDPGTLHWRLCWMMNDCVPRWMVGGPQNLRETQSCQSVLLHPTLHPTPRWGLRLQTHRPRSVPGNIPGTCQSYNYAEHFFYHLRFFSSGFDCWHHPSTQHVPAAGQRARTPEALQQEGPTHGLDQEKRTLQQPIGHLTSYTRRFYSK